MFLISDSSTSEWGKLYLIQRNLWNWKIWTRRPWARKLIWLKKKMIVYRLRKGVYDAVDARLYRVQHCSISELQEAIDRSFLSYLLIFIDENYKLNVRSRNVLEEKNTISRVEKLLRNQQEL